MKNNIDVAFVLFRKGEGDLRTAKRNMAAGEDLDFACYHCQQAGEKFLKAYLESMDIDYPYSHNLNELIKLCISIRPEFETVKSIAENLTNYAVTIRYDDIVIPAPRDAERAFQDASQLREFVIACIPKALLSLLTQ